MEIREYSKQNDQPLISKLDVRQEATKMIESHQRQYDALAKLPNAGDAQKRAIEDSRRDLKDFLERNGAADLYQELVKSLDDELKKILNPKEIKL